MARADPSRLSTPSSPPPEGPELKCRNSVLLVDQLNPGVRIYRLGDFLSDQISPRVRIYLLDRLNPESESSELSVWPTSPRVRIYPLDELIRKSGFSVRPNNPRVRIYLFNQPNPKVRIFLLKRVKSQI